MYNKKKPTTSATVNLFGKREKASQIQKKGKILISGPTNAGKTLSGLLLLKGLTNSGKVFLLDSENKRSALHVGDPLLGDWTWEASYCTSDDFNGFNVAQAIEEAEKAGYEGMLIDSYSHIWEAVNETAQALGGRYTDFKEAKRPYKQFLKALINANIHIICTSRSAMDYTQDVDSTGRKTVTKLGLKPIGDSTFPYEVDFHFVIDQDHNAKVDKTTRGMFEDIGRFRITEQHGQTIRAFLEEGLPADYQTRQLYISRIRELLQDAEVKKLEIEFLYSDEELLEKTSEELAQIGKELKEKVKVI